MKVYNSQDNSDLSPGLINSLEQIRLHRDFDPYTWLELKARLLNDYCSYFNLKSLVIAVSGGVDSAVVLALACHCAKMENSPIERIVALALPIFNQGATGQQLAVDRAQELCDFLKTDLKVVDLTEVQESLSSRLETALNQQAQPWAQGQLTAYVRTPAIYYCTSLLVENDTPGLVLGTTNRDEGAYLGYIGKASDGMVDLQVISDLHKSEVYKVANYFNLPQSIIEVVPQGDMFDGRSDEEVFGTSYDFVELYLNWLTDPKVDPSWDKHDQQVFEILSSKLEKLHRYNGHKYLGKSPAVHLNVYQSAVPGGWDHPIVEKVEDIVC